MEQRIENIQSLRGLAVMLVIMFHLVSSEKNYGQGYRLLSDYWAIGMSGVDMFFVISGFVMMVISRSLFKRKGVAWRFLYDRITRIYPLYWTFSLLALVLFLARPDLLKRNLHAGEVDVIGSFLLLPQHEAPLLMTGWTLIHEMYFYLVVAMMLFFSERKVPVFLGLWAGVVICANLFLTPFASPAFQLLTHPLTIEFIIGCLVALIIHRGVTCAGMYCLITGVLAWVGGYTLHAYLGLGLEPTGWSRVVLFGIPSALVIYGMVVLEITKGKRLPNWAIQLGDASYSIYLSHILVMGALGRIGVGYESTARADIRPIILMIMVSTIIAFGMACYRFVEKPMIHAARRVLVR